MIKIVLADDHLIVRNGLKALIKNEDDLEVVGEAASGPDAIAAVNKLLPDVLVLDLVMPGMNGLEVIGKVVRSSPVTGIVILSMYNNEGYVFEAFSSGARAYVIKDNTSEELVTAIRQVYAGKSYIGKSLNLKSFEISRSKTVLNKVKL
jgi:two-component system, NarL family, response regulator NreC